MPAAGGCLVGRGPPKSRDDSLDRLLGAASKKEDVAGAVATDDEMAR